MKILEFAAALVLFSTTPLFAGSFSFSGPGGAVPASGTGGGGTYPTTLPPNPFISSIFVPHPVIEIDNVFINGLFHTSAGNLQAVLRDPDGKMYNLFVRSGFNGTGSGNSSNFVGSLNISNAVTGFGADFPGSGDIVGGFFRQDFCDSGTPPFPWIDGTANVFNTPTHDIVAPAGNWSLVIYDWEAVDAGTIFGWNLSGVDDFPPISNYCFGDGSLVACPCGNNGVAGHGCENSASTGGSLLNGSGSVNPDSVVLTVTGELPTALSIFIQGTANIVTPQPFGDGLACFGGFIKRLYVKNAVGGTTSAPAGADPSITARSAALGDTIPLGSIRYYQVYYRDANPTFCASPTGSTFNISNGVRVVWY